MSDWLTKAQQALGYGTEEVREQPFEVVCACGWALRGIRHEQHQEMLCARCGETVFVLPVDVYPQPKPKKRRKKQPAQAARSLKKVTPVRDDGPPIRERMRKRMRNVRSQVTQGVKRKVERQIAFFTPFRLVLICMASIVVATAYWIIHRDALERAEVTLKTAGDNGYAALGEGNFAAAAREFQKARDALDLLGRDDEKARSIRQMWRESTAISQLATESFYDILRGLAESSQKNPSRWTEDFQRRYRNSWIVIETIVEQTAHVDGGARVVIDFPLLVDSRPVVIEADLAVFKRFPTGEGPRNVIFAAQLDSCRVGGSLPGRWIITLNPDSGFLWTDDKNYRALGFQIDEFHTEQAVRDLLAAQARWMGLVP